MPAPTAASPLPYCLGNDTAKHPAWNAVDYDNAVSWACDKMAEFGAKLGKPASGIHGNAYGLWNFQRSKVEAIPDNKIEMGMLFKNAPDSCPEGVDTFDFAKSREDCVDVMNDWLGRGCK